MRYMFSCMVALAGIRTILHYQAALAVERSPSNIDQASIRRLHNGQGLLVQTRPMLYGVRSWEYSDMGNRSNRAPAKIRSPQC